MLSSLVKPALAQTSSGVNIGEHFTPALKGFTSVAALVNILLPNILTIAGVVTLAIVVIAGFKVIQHGIQGESESIAKNKNALTYAIMGLVLILGAYFIMEILEVILGYNLLVPSV